MPLPQTRSTKGERERTTTTLALARATAISDKGFFLRSLVLSVLSASAVSQSVREERVADFPILSLAAAVAAAVDVSSSQRMETMVTLQPVYEAATMET